MQQSILDAGPATVPSLLDPDICGEDQLYNLSRAPVLARLYCDGCADYRATTAVNRLNGRSGWQHSRPVLIDFVRSHLRARADRESGPIDVLIAGSADTSILSTCAHGAWAAGPDVLARSRFTVLDRCPTPLELCREYAGRHGLDVTTVVTDLTKPAAPHEADLVVLHSILIFLPVTSHAKVLRDCGAWLKPGGRIWLWNALQRKGRDREVHDMANVVREMRDLIDAETRAGRLTLGEPVADFLSRLGRSRNRSAGAHEFKSLGEFEALLATAGLPVHSLSTVERTIQLSEGPPIDWPNAVAILGGPAG